MKIFLSVTLAGLFLLLRHLLILFLGVENSARKRRKLRYVEIKECDGKICGEMLKAFDSSDKEIDSKNIGRNIILGMSPKKDGKYGGGKIWAPDEDKTYRSKMKLVSENDLKVSGCIAIICVSKIGLA